MSKDSNAKIFSVVGGCRRSGRWLVPAKTKMMTLFGRAVIDLRHAQTAAEEIEFTCLSVFANITFLVPEGAEVRPSGLAIFGSSRSTVPLSDTTCELPPMSIDATTVFGRLRVRTTEVDPDGKPSRRSSRKQRKAAGPVEAVATVVATNPDTPDGVDTLDVAAAAAPPPAARPEPKPSTDLSAPITAFVTDDEPASGGFVTDDEGAPSSGFVTDDEEAPSSGFVTDDEPASGGFVTDDEPASGGFVTDDATSPIEEVAVPDNAEAVTEGAAK